jgi:lysophospholipase L1-like esterase
MPPKKAKQPTAVEIAVLRDWVKAGAKNDSAKQTRFDDAGDERLALGEESPVVFQDAIKIKEGDRLVFLGDSITAGGNSGNGYVNLIREKLNAKFGFNEGEEKGKKFKKSKVEVIGAGISGNRVPNLQKRVDKDVIARKPTIVVIYIGINDVWHGQYDPSKGTSPEDYEKGLKEIIGKIQKADARVVLCTPTVIGELKAGGNKLDAKLDQYSDVSRKVAKDTGATLCDLRKAFVDYLAKNNANNASTGNLTTDRPIGVHLNDAANRLVAETILKCLGE